MSYTRPYSSAAEHHRTSVEYVRPTEGRRLSLQSASAFTAATQVPFNLARRFPHLVHMDEDRINRPNFDELELIWGAARFDWRRNYAVHLWYRLWKDVSPYFHGVEPNDDNVKTWNSTFGEMARAILYGSERLARAPVL